MSAADNLKNGEYTVKASPEALAQSADKLKKLLERLNRTLEATAGRVRATSSYWDGSAARDLRQDGKECERLAEAAGAQLLRRAEELEQIAGNYAQAEKQAEDEAQRLPSSILS